MKLSPRASLVFCLVCSLFAAAPAFAGITPAQKAAAKVELLLDQAVAATRSAKVNKCLTKSGFSRLFSGACRKAMGAIDAKVEAVGAGLVELTAAFQAMGRDPALSDFEQLEHLAAALKWSSVGLRVSAVQFAVTMSHYAEDDYKAAVVDYVGQVRVLAAEIDAELKQDRALN